MEKSIDIDGIAQSGEWTNAKEVYIGRTDPVVDQYGRYEGVWETEEADPADFATFIRFMWDEEAFYILEERFDDYVELGGYPTEPWNGSDGNLIFLQLIDAFKEGNEEGWSHHIFYIAGDGNGELGGSAAVRIPNRMYTMKETVEYDEIEVKSAIVNDGWSIEVKVPWSVFRNEIPSFVPADGVEVGLNIIPIDYDEGGDFGQISWVKLHEELGVTEGIDYGGWATLKLTAAPEPEPEVTEDPADAVGDVVEDVTDAPAAGAPETADAGIAAAAVLTVAAGAVIYKRRRH